jgi:membrane fusion protein, multidrug efflux system
VARQNLPIRSKLPIVLIAGLALAGCKEENAYVPPPPPQVGVAKPMQQPVTPYLEATGDAVAYNQVDLEARVEGYLQKINYQDGAAAKQADTLFVIEPAPYLAKLQQAQATQQATQAQLVQAQAEYQRQATLLRQDVTAQNTYDIALAKRDTLQANLLNDQAGVTQAAINYGYTQVTAPFDGQVSAHLVSIGGLVGTPGPTKLATIVQLDPIYATFTISEQDVLRVKAAMAKRGIKDVEIDKVPVEVGLMNEVGYPHAGKLNYIAPSIDPATGTLTVRGLLPNADHALVPGNFLRIRIPMERQEQTALLVPDRALGADQSGAYLLVVDQNGVVQQRTVTTGQLVGNLRVIATGLMADDRVVISGNQKAIPGERVAPQDTAITAEATPPPAGKS